MCVGVCVSQPQQPALISDACYLCLCLCLCACMYICVCVSAAAQDSRFACVCECVHIYVHLMYLRSSDSFALLFCSPFRSPFLLFAH